MTLRLGPVLEVKASIINHAGGVEPMAQQVFYVLEKSPDDLLRGTDFTSEIKYAKTMNALRNHALTFFVTDSQGKAEIKKLKTETYHICGIGYTQQGVVIWNVRIDLQPGGNSLVLDNSNLASIVRA
jgi:hypothetical protein